MSNPPPSPRLLVVDDEPDLRTLYELTLLREGYDVECAGSVEEAWSLLQDRGPGTFQLVITDMRLPDSTGLELLRRIDEAGRHEKAMVITAYGSPENAVEALKAGAYDYLTKPVDLRQFRAVVASALGRALPPSAPSSGPAPGQSAGHGGATSGSPSGGKTATQRPSTGQAPDNSSASLLRMAGDSGAMQQVRSLVQKVARSMAPVLVHGESGTGKELVARAIHGCSPRSGGPFVAVNCGAIPELLLEAEFFGYRKGAFTGANDDREGFFQAAQGGTLFLDEIGDLPVQMQSKLLRVIQERSVRPLGAVTEIALNVRIVSATHRELGQEVVAGRFRQDLYYRLNVIHITVPPLRERMSDLPLICTSALARIAQDSGAKVVPKLSAAALQLLMRYDFPGNVRELENLLHRALALSAGPDIDADDLEVPLGARPAGHAAAYTQGTKAAEFADPLGPSGAGRDGASRGGPSAPESAASTTSTTSIARPVEAEWQTAELGVAVKPSSGQLPGDLVSHLDQVEREILERALERHRYNRTAAGASMGLTLRQMRYRMARLGVGVDNSSEDSGDPNEFGAQDSSGDSTKGD